MRINYAVQVYIYILVHGWIREATRMYIPQCTKCIASYSSIIIAWLSNVNIKYIATFIACEWQQSCFKFCIIGIVVVTL